MERIYKYEYPLKGKIETIFYTLLSILLIYCLFLPFNGFIEKTIITILLLFSVFFIYRGIKLYLSSLKWNEITVTESYISFPFAENGNRVTLHFNEIDEIKEDYITGYFGKTHFIQITNNIYQLKILRSWMDEKEYESLKNKLLS